MILSPRFAWVACVVNRVVTRLGSLGASPNRQDGLAEGAVFFDPGCGELDYHPSIVHNLGFGAVSGLPAVELRSRALAQVSPQLSVSDAAVGAGDQLGFVIRSSVLHGVRRHGATADHAGDFELSFPERAGDHVSPNVLPVECPAEVTKFLFHRTAFVTLRDSCLSWEGRKEPPSLRLSEQPLTPRPKEHHPEKD